MDCAEKKQLQQACSETWEALESATQQLPFPIHALTSLFACQPQSGFAKSESPLLNIIARDRAHRAASHALSRHLQRHRC